MNYFGLTANLIDACFIVLGKTGKILNARGNRICFLLDMICLIYWFFIDMERGLYSQAIGVFFSFSIAVYGFRKWGKIKDDKKESVSELFRCRVTKNIMGDDYRCSNTFIRENIGDAFDYPSCQQCDPSSKRLDNGEFKA